MSAWIRNHPWLAGCLIIATLLLGATTLLFLVEVDCPICAGRGWFAVESVNEPSGETQRGNIPCRGCRHGRVSLFWRAVFRIHYGV